MKNTHFEKPAIGGSIRRQYVNPDLQEERDRCNFDPIEVENFITVPGAREHYAKTTLHHMEHPELKSHPYFLELDRDTQQKLQWERAAKLMKIDPDYYFYNVKDGVFSPLAGNPHIDITTLHYGMF